MLNIKTSRSRIGDKSMKTKILIATLLGCLAWQQGALSQTDTIATNPPSPDAVAPTSQSAAASTNEVPAATATTNTPAAPVAAATDAPAAAASPAAAPAADTANATNTPTATDVTGSNQTASAQPAAPPTIPLIQFQDVPITTAIENLARQAGINYLVDPKIGYGQPDQNGQIKPEPTLSIRWENVTAEQALLALLDNYGLQLISDRKSQIARITPKDPTAPPPLSPVSFNSNMPARQTWWIRFRLRSRTNAARYCRMSAPASWSSWPPRTNRKRWTR